MKYNLYNMMGLDIYLASLSKLEYEAVSTKICSNSRIVTPLMSWDIYSQDYLSRLREAERNQDIIKVKSYANKFYWQNDIDLIFEDEMYEAIIITDVNQNIVWVNAGFSKMTGYAKKEVVNKTPRILQGGKTSKASRRSIKQKLTENLPFEEVITNYKKEGDSYKCEVKIFPLHAHGDKTHFIALERKVG